MFDSQDLPEQWVCFDFRDMRVTATHYMIRTTGAGERGPHLKSWVIEGSLDGQRWTELDRKKNDGQLKGRNAYASFAMSTSAEVRMIRLRQTGKNHVGNNYLALSAFEVFGTISGIPQTVGEPRHQDFGLQRLRSARPPLAVYNHSDTDEPERYAWESRDFDSLPDRDFSDDSYIG
jgi:hypothetical protein